MAITKSLTSTIRKSDFRASAARLVEVTDRYPLYSQNDDALWMLGNIYERAKQVSKNEDDKNHWSDLASKCYDRIVRDYPLSKVAPGAKARLKDMGRPVPSADPDAIVRMQKQQLYEKTASPKHGRETAVGNAQGQSGRFHRRPRWHAANGSAERRSFSHRRAPARCRGPIVYGDGQRSGIKRANIRKQQRSGHARRCHHRTSRLRREQTGVGVEILTPLDDKGQPTSEQPATTAPAPETPARDTNAPGTAAPRRQPRPTVPWTQA